MKISKSSRPVSNFVKGMVLVAVVGLLAVSAIPNLLWGTSSAFAHSLIAAVRNHWGFGSAQTLTGLNWAWMTIFASSTFAALAVALPLHRLVPANFMKSGALKVG